LLVRLSVPNPLRPLARAWRRPVVAFGRVYHGTVDRGQKAHPAHLLSSANSNHTKARMAQPTPNPAIAPPIHSSWPYIRISKNAPTIIAINGKNM
jgi:hypothetical protein